MHGMAATGAEATQGNVAVTTESTAPGILWHIPCRDCALPRPLTSLPEGFVPRELQDQLTLQQVESLAVLTTHDQLTASQCDAFSQRGYAADPSRHGGGLAEAGERSEEACWQDQGSRGRCYGSAAAGI